MYSKVIHGAVRVGRHILHHAHEVMPAIVVESTSMHFALILFIIGALLIVFAIQVALNAEAV